MFEAWSRLQCRSLINSDNTHRVQNISPCYGIFFYLTLLWIFQLAITEDSSNTILTQNCNGYGGEGTNKKYRTIYFNKLILLVSLNLDWQQGIRSMLISCGWHLPRGSSDAQKCQLSVSQLMVRVGKELFLPLHKTTQAFISSLLFFF